MCFRYLMVAVALAIFSTPVSAQFTGPGTGGGGCTTVKDVLRNTPDDAWVTLRGRITQKVGHEKYLFTDGTGQITVEIDDKNFPYDTPITPKTKIEISGEVDKELIGRTEIDVKQMTILGEGTAQTPKGGFQSK
ncbi:MAG: hypothetical protein BWX80_04045 [Candidatus Hydrogenedentes bacterium ADurb.Bin101]|jgi:uncharacterized protein (TIGR00156 family)|nr:MAG: hypothetical protein BWX80_04045 [Candidatus Hydrogenedentes bacterium ADurb.Bin101]